MIEDIRRRGALWRKKFNQNFFLNAVRNRKGHRPIHSNKARGNITIASYNIHKCVGTDKKFDPERIISVIQELNADILALQETDKRFGKRVGLFDCDILQQKTGLRRVPIQTMAPNGLGWHGNALFYKNAQVRDIAQPTLPGVEPRGALIVEFELANKNPIRVIAAHLGLLHRSRYQQAKMLLAFIEKRETMPTIMIGDLNEWRIGKNSSLNPLSSYFDIQLGTLPSFPAHFPILALDRVFAFPSNMIATMDTHVSPLSKVASDHLPIKARLDMETAIQTIKDMDCQAI